ncbi:hypothetical protein T4B_10221, partial [Trichinella pseudospiralis]
KASPVATIYSEVASVASEDSHTAVSQTAISLEKLQLKSTNFRDLVLRYQNLRNHILAFSVARNIKLLLWSIIWCLDSLYKVVLH